MQQGLFLKINMCGFILFKYLYASKLYLKQQQLGKSFRGIVMSPNPHCNNAIEWLCIQAHTLSAAPYRLPHTILHYVLPHLQPQSHVAFVRYGPSPSTTFEGGKAVKGTSCLFHQWKSDGVETPHISFLESEVNVLFSFGCTIRISAFMS